MEKIEGSNEQKYPSVGLAYHIALKSYDLAIQRLNAVDDRTDKLLVWISSITLGVIAIVGGSKTASTDVFNHWFLLALAVFVVTLCFGLYIKQYGSLKIVDPGKIINFLGKTEWEFQKDMIYFAEWHFSDNIGLVNRKGLYTNYLIGLFIAETGLLIAWIFSLMGV